MTPIKWNISVWVLPWGSIQKIVNHADRWAKWSNAEPCNKSVEETVESSVCSTGGGITGSRTIKALNPHTPSKYCNFRHEEPSCRKTGLFTHTIQLQFFMNSAEGQILHQHQAQFESGDKWVVHVTLLSFSWSAGVGVLFFFFFFKELLRWFVLTKWTYPVKGHSSNYTQP